MFTIQPQSHFSIKNEQFANVFFTSCSFFVNCLLLPFWLIYYNCYFYVLLNAASYAFFFAAMSQVSLNFFGHFFYFLCTIFIFFFWFLLFCIILAVAVPVECLSRLFMRKRPVLKASKWSKWQKFVQQFVDFIFWYLLLIEKKKLISTVLSSHFKPCSMNLSYKFNRKMLNTIEIRKKIRLCPSFFLY